MVYSVSRVKIMEYFVFRGGGGTPPAITSFPEIAIRPRHSPSLVAFNEGLQRQTF